MDPSVCISELHVSVKTEAKEGIINSWTRGHT